MEVWGMEGARVLYILHFLHILHTLLPHVLLLPHSKLFQFTNCLKIRKENWGGI